MCVLGIGFHIMGCPQVERLLEKNARAFVEILQLNEALACYKEAAAKERPPKKEGEEIGSSTAAIPIPASPEMRDIKKRIEHLKLGVRRRLTTLAAWSDMQLYEKRRLLEW